MKESVIVKNKNIIRYILKIINKPIVLSYFFIILFISSIEIIMPVFEAKVIDSLWNDGVNKGVFFFLIIMCIILKGLFYVLLYNIFFKAKSSIIKNISSEVLNSLISFNRNKIKEKGAGFYHEFLSREPEQIALCANPSGVFFVFSVIIAIVASFISLKYSYSFFIIFPAAIILYILLDNFFAKLMDGLVRSILDIDYKAEPKFINYIKNAKTISKFGNDEFYFSALTAFEQKNLKVKTKYIIIKELRNGLSEIISSLAFVLIICILCFDIINGNLTFGSFIILLSYFGLILMPLLYHSQYKMTLLDATASMELLNTINSECENSLSAVSEFNSLEKSGLSVEKICFSYANKNNNEDKLEDNMEYQYTDISFSISRGERLGFVGVSGEGKSTIVKLLLGELIPNSGTIKINGVEVSKLPLPILDHLICVYEQTNVILPGDLYENICLGRELVSDEKYTNTSNEFSALFSKAILNNKFPIELAMIFGINIVKPSNEEKKFLEVFFDSSPDPKFLAELYTDNIMVRKVKVDDLIKNLGLKHLHNRNLGNEGAEISGGERERIAMARFLTKEHASLYIIDEPFTSLDTKTEKECLDFLCKEIKNKNIFVISHKFNVLKALTDKCIVMKAGKIFEEGTHQELENKQGLYSELLAHFNLQRETAAV